MSSHPLVCVGAASDDRRRESLCVSPSGVGWDIVMRSLWGIERPKKLSVKNSNSGGMLLSAGGKIPCGFDPALSESPALAALMALVGKEAESW